LGDELFNFSLASRFKKRIKLSNCPQGMNRLFVLIKLAIGWTTSVAHVE
jgi:hypothetical protein